MLLGQRYKIEVLKIEVHGTYGVSRIPQKPTLEHLLQSSSTFMFAGVLDTSLKVQV